MRIKHKSCRLRFFQIINYYNLCAVNVNERVMTIIDDNPFDYIMMITTMHYHWLWMVVQSARIDATYVAYLYGIVCVRIYSYEPFAYRRFSFFHNLSGLSLIINRTAWRSNKTTSALIRRKTNMHMHIILYVLNNDSVSKIKYNWYKQLWFCLNSSCKCVRL